jgi:phenylacetic acid degradation operon negative regulatory protein
VTSSFVGPFGAIGTEQDVVAQAWNLAEVEAAYEEFVETFGAADPATPDEVLRHQIHLVHAWRRFPFLDPQLPAALLPDDWAGARAAALFNRQHERWHQPAQQRWQELAASNG